MISRTSVCGVLWAHDFMGGAPSLTENRILKEGGKTEDVADKVFVS